jgi:hypothetical protein
LNDGSVKELDTYLGTDVCMHEVACGGKAWAISLDSMVYVWHTPVEEVECELAQVSMQLKKKLFHLWFPEKDLN